MYTGIVQAMLPVGEVVRLEGLMSFRISLPDPLVQGLETGASVAVNGVCFTVTAIEGTQVWFDAMQQTLSLTNIGSINPGSQVNIERSATADAEIGGHIVSGHIMGMAITESIEESPNNRRIWFQGDPAWMKYVFNKGFIALNGASLTVSELDRDTHRFAINLIPETIKRTNFGLLSPGDPVNVEVEHQTQVIVDTLTSMVRDGAINDILKTGSH